MLSMEESPSDYFIRAHLDILDNTRTQACLTDFVRGYFKDCKVFGVKETKGKPHLHFVIQLPDVMKDKYMLKIRNAFNYACPYPGKGTGRFSFSNKWGDAKRPCPHNHLQNHLNYLTKENKSFSDLILNLNDSVNETLWTERHKEYLKAQLKIKIDTVKRKETTSENFINYIEHHTDASTVLLVLIELTTKYIFKERKARNGSHHVVKAYVLLALYSIPHFGWEKNYQRQFNNQVLESMNFDSTFPTSFQFSDTASDML